jgi:hypothetical protein
VSCGSIRRERWVQVPIEGSHRTRFAGPAARVLHLSPGFRANLPYSKSHLALLSNTGEDINAKPAGCHVSEHRPARRSTWCDLNLHSVTISVKVQNTRLTERTVLLQNVAKCSRSLVPRAGAVGACSIRRGPLGKRPPGVSRTGRLPDPEGRHRTGPHCRSEHPAVSTVRVAPGRGILTGYPSHAEPGGSYSHRQRPSNLSRFAESLERLLEYQGYCSGLA